MGPEPWPRRGLKGQDELTLLSSTCVGPDPSYTHTATPNPPNPLRGGHESLGAGEYSPSQPSGREGRTRRQCPEEEDMVSGVGAHTRSLAITVQEP